MTTLFATEHAFTTDRDLSSKEFWARSFVQRDETFARLRANAPVSWHRPLEVGVPQEVHGEAGFWAVTRPADIRHVSLHHDIFSSALGNVRLRPLDPGERRDPSFIAMDPPEHTRYRRIMSGAFTPKAVARLNAKINERAERIVEAVVGRGDFDFVAEVSAKLPMLTIADMVGVSDDLIEIFAQAGDRFVGAIAADPALPEGANRGRYILEQLTVIREIGTDLVRHRRAHPADDIATAIAKAEFDGRPLDDPIITSIMLLLSVAGNDTTKQTTSWTALNLQRNPEQKAWLLEDFEGRIEQATEEFVRHASPVIQFTRTATQNTELAGQLITAGDKVAIFYCSGNRDKALFPDPHRFDLARPRTQHVGFGGGGVHFCLGHVVAKAQLRALFEQILTKLPRLEITGEPELLRSEFINGITRLPASTG
jgi:cytochrome P450